MSEGRTPEVGLLVQVEQVTALVKSADLCCYREAVFSEHYVYGSDFQAIRSHCCTEFVPGSHVHQTVKVAGIQGYCPEPIYNNGNNE